MNKQQLTVALESIGMRPGRGLGTALTPTVYL